MRLRLANEIIGMGGVAVFAASVLVLGWLGNAAGFIVGVHEHFGGLIGQLAIWIIGIMVTVYLALRVIAVVLGGNKRKDNS